MLGNGGSETNQQGKGVALSLVLIENLKKKYMIKDFLKSQVSQSKEKNNYKHKVIVHLLSN